MGSKCRAKKYKPDADISGTNQWVQMVFEGASSFPITLEISSYNQSPLLKVSLVYLYSRESKTTQGHHLVLRYHIAPLDGSSGK